MTRRTHPTNPMKPTGRIIKYMERKEPLLQNRRPSIRSSLDTLEWMRKRRINRGIREVPFLTPEEARSFSSR